MPTKGRDLELLVAIDRWNFRLALLVILATGALGFARPIWIGVSVGAVLVTLNFRVVRRIGEKLVASEGKPKFLGMFYLKMLAFLVVTGLVLRFVPMHRGAFVVGLSVFVVSTLLVAIIRGLTSSAADEGDSVVLDEQAGQPVLGEATSVRTIHHG